MMNVAKVVVSRLRWKVIDRDGSIVSLCRFKLNIVSLLRGAHV